MCLVIRSLAVACALALCAPDKAIASEPLACTSLEIDATRTVTRIIDGETVMLDDGTELRLVGALAPRARDAGAAPDTWPLEIAAREELNALLLGKSVQLAFGGERTDRYGRLQAHAIWTEGDRRRWVQGHLLEQGLARAYTQAGNRACSDELLAAERMARKEGRGLWGEAAYQVRRADEPSDVAAYRTTFQVLEGRIVRVAQLRGAIYLNFGANRSAFSVSLRRGDSGLLGTYAQKPAALAGKQVRVRGWILQGSGPSIDLSTAGHIEVVEDAGEPVGRNQRRHRAKPAVPATEERPAVVETRR
jgi:micrococcal nuclease